MTELFVPLNLFNPRKEILDTNVAKVMNLPGAHPFFNAHNFTLPQSIFDKFNELGLTISLTKTFLFKLEPNAAGPIHLDGNVAIGKLRPYGFNWAWGAPNTTMEWFDHSGKAMHREYQGIEIPYFDDTNTTPIGSAILESPNLVNLLHPHRVVNHTDKFRLCLSVGIDSNLEWNELVTLLAQKQILR